MTSPETEVLEEIEAPELTIEQEVAQAYEDHKAAEAGDDRPRAPDGKFIAVECEDAEPAAEAETPAVEAEAEPAAADEPIIPDRLALPPQYAKKGIREKWAELPVEVREEVYEREREIHQQMTRYDEERNFGKQVKQVVGPYEGFIRQLGSDPVQAVDYLIKTDYALRTAAPEQRKALFMKAAADYGIQLGGNDFQADPFAPPVDPRIETMQQQLTRLENDRTHATQQAQLAEQASIEQQITDFASRLENVFFDRVSPFMATLLESGQAANLEEAYDMAVYANPETRELQQAAQSAQSQRTQALLKQAEADKARAASVSVTGAPGPSVEASSPNTAGSLEDDIRQAIQAASSRI